jgi:hypothetical protein
MTNHFLRILEETTDEEDYYGETAHTHHTSIGIYFLVLGFMFMCCAWLRRFLSNTREDPAVLEDSSMIATRPTEKISPEERKKMLLKHFISNRTQMVGENWQPASEMIR